MSLPGRKMLKVFKSVLLVFLVLMLGCESYKEVDFQEERCKQAPSGEIKITQKGNLRWEFELVGLSTALETEPLRVVWAIDGGNFAARRVSYQFEKRGSQKISVVMTNRCFMQTLKETTINISN